MLTKTTVGGWATSNNDLSNHNMRIDVTLLEDRRAVINNSIHKENKQLQRISAYRRFKIVVLVCYFANLTIRSCFPIYVDKDHSWRLGYFKQ
jgi:hypothetical protein